MFTAYRARAIRDSLHQVVAQQRLRCAGLELFAPRRAWLFGRLGYGIAAEVNAITYPLRGSRCKCLIKPGNGALSLVLGW